MVAATSGTCKEQQQHKTKVAHTVLEHQHTQAPGIDCHKCTTAPKYQGLPHNSKQWNLAVLAKKKDRSAHELNPVLAKP
jgi:hypothetical protein